MSIGSRTAAKSSTTAGSRNGCRPTPTAADPGSTASPNISATQISADRSGSSSSPTIQNATIDRGVTTARARSSMYPPDGVHPQNASCSSRTRTPSRYGCWPRVPPTGPDQLPDWMPDTRIGGVWSSAHQRPWSGGMRRCRHESRSS